MVDILIFTTPIEDDDKDRVATSRRNAVLHDIVQSYDTWDIYDQK